MMEQKAGIPYISIVLGFVAIGIIGFLGYTNYTQSQKIDMLLEERNFFLLEKNRVETALASASSSNITLQNELRSIQEELEGLADDYRDEKDRNEEFEDQIRDLAGTLGDLDKLSKTDEELLQKYSKVYFLNENYIPSRLSKIDDDFVLAGKPEQYFHAQAVDQLEDMLEAAEEDGYNIKITSAYRSFDAQSELKGQYTQIYGSGANTFSADQGYSEHQLGTTLDLTTEGVGGAYTSFADTEEYKWLLENAHRFGFILSYPHDNTFYVFEPWHWRYVGTDLARDLHRANADFYDWDQREIDKYLLTIFD